MKKYSLINVLKKLFKILETKSKLKFFIIFLIMIVSAILTQLTPKIIGWIIDDILSQDNIIFNKVIPFLVLILIVNVVNEVIKIIRRLLVEDISTRCQKKARSLVIESLLKAPLSYFRKNMTGNIHGRFNRCLDGVVKLIKILFMDFAPTIFSAIAAIVTIYITLPFYLASAMLFVVPIGVAITLFQIKSQKGIRVKLLAGKSQMDGLIVELISGIEVIRISNSVENELNRFDIKSEDLRSKEMKHHYFMAIYDVFKFLNQVVFTVLIISLSSYLASINIISVGSVLTAYLCFNQLIKPLEELHRIIDEVSENTILASDYFQLKEIENDFSYKNLISNYKDNINNVSVSISNLDFYYDDNNDVKIIDNLNLEIKKGEFIGIVGPSGCGKTSLIKAISKLEKHYGNLFIEGCDINDLTRDDISKIISLVPQNPFLISGTIYDNVIYGLNYKPSYESVLEALEKAYLKDYVLSLDNKLDTYISENGKNLSGGQKQRLCLARIFLQNPKILILDEATSALDNTSEIYIQNEIEKLKQNSTTVIAIAHRLTTLKNFDRIIVLNKGKIEQVGTFNSLLETDGIFNDMYNGRLK